jgi:hypothetical protein
VSTPSIAKSRNLKTAASKKRSVKSSATARRKVTSAATPAKMPPKSDEAKVERVTKQERLLTLLSQAEGASIEEMMQATDWQQHSVRGSLAGTVKKKLGFLADHFESGRRRPPLPHRDPSRSLTWPSRRLISRSRWRGFPPRRSSNCAASGGGCIGHHRPCGCLLLRAITYKLQERPLDGLSKSTIRKLERLNLDSEASDAQKPAPPISLKAGTRLVREWRGVTSLSATPFQWAIQPWRTCSVMRAPRIRALVSLSRLVT